MMPFMQPRAEHIRMLHIETTEGTEHVPLDLVGVEPASLREEHLKDYVCGAPCKEADGSIDASLEAGWYAWLSAPGFMDQTDKVGPFENESDALDMLANVHDVCRDCWETCWESEAGTCQKEGGE